MTVPRKDKTLEELAETTTEILHIVSALRLQREDTSRSLGRIPTLDFSRSRSLEINQETRTTLFSSEKLRELSAAYVAYVHVLHPMFQAPQNMCDGFIEDYSDAAPIRRDSITPNLRNANVLLFFALGNCVSIGDRSGTPSTPPGMTYYRHVQAILEQNSGEHTADLAQTMTLAALYTNQFGRLQDSWDHIRVACHIYERLGY